MRLQQHFVQMRNSLERAVLCGCAAIFRPAFTAPTFPPSGASCGACEVNRLVTTTAVTAGAHQLQVLHALYTKVLPEGHD